MVANGNALSTLDTTELDLFIGDTPVEIGQKRMPLQPEIRNAIRVARRTAESEGKSGAGVIRAQNEAARAVRTTMAA